MDDQALSQSNIIENIIEHFDPSCADEQMVCRAARLAFAAAQGGQIMMTLSLAEEVVKEWTGHDLAPGDAAKLPLLHAEEDAFLIPADATDQHTLLQKTHTKPRTSSRNKLALPPLYEEAAHALVDEDAAGTRTAESTMPERAKRVLLSLPSMKDVPIFRRSASSRRISKLDSIKLPSHRATVDDPQPMIQLDWDKTASLSAQPSSAAPETIPSHCGSEAESDAQPLYAKTRRQATDVPSAISTTNILMEATIMDSPDTAAARSSSLASDLPDQGQHFLSTFDGPFCALSKPRIMPTDSQSPVSGHNEVRNASGCHRAGHDCGCNYIARSEPILKTSSRG